MINRGTIPGVLLDGSMAAFTVQAVIAAMELGVFDELRVDSLHVKRLVQCNQHALQEIAGIYLESGAG